MTLTTTLNGYLKNEVWLSQLTSPAAQDYCRQIPSNDPAHIPYQSTVLRNRKTRHVYPEPTSPLVAHLSGYTMEVRTGRTTCQRMYPASDIPDQPAVLSKRINNNASPESGFTFAEHPMDSDTKARTARSTFLTTNPASDIPDLPTVLRSRKNNKVYLKPVFTSTEYKIENDTNARITEAGLTNPGTDHQPPVNAGNRQHDGKEQGSCSSVLSKTLALCNSLAAGAAGMAGSAYVRDTNIITAHNIAMMVVHQTPDLLDIIPVEGTRRRVIETIVQGLFAAGLLTGALGCAYNAATASSFTTMCCICLEFILGGMAHWYVQGLIRDLCKGLIPEPLQRYLKSWCQAAGHIGMSHILQQIWHYARGGDGSEQLQIFPGCQAARLPDGTIKAQCLGIESIKTSEVRLAEGYGYGLISVNADPVAAHTNNTTSDSYYDRSFTNGIQTTKTGEQVCVDLGEITTCFSANTQVTILPVRESVPGENVHRGQTDGATPSPVKNATETTTTESPSINVDALAGNTIVKTASEGLSLVLDSFSGIMHSIDRRLQFPSADATVVSDSVPESRYFATEPGELTATLLHNPASTIPAFDQRDPNITPTSIPVSVPESRYFATEPGELTATLLHNPASTIPSFDHRNPNITSTEQSYEYARLVLGLSSPKYDAMEDYQWPVDFAPVLSHPGEPGSVVEYQPITLARGLSPEQVDYLARHDPKRKHPDHGQRQITLPKTLQTTRAWPLGEACYQPSVWDRFLSALTPDHPAQPKTINQVIASCFRFIPGQGYQLTEPALTHLEVLTGQCLDRACTAVIERLYLSGIITRLRIPVLAKHHRTTDYYLQWEKVSAVQATGDITIDDTTIDDTTADHHQSRTSTSSPPPAPTPDDSPSHWLQATPYSLSGQPLDVRRWRHMSLSDIGDQEIQQLTTPSGYLKDGSTCRSLAGYVPFIEMIRDDQSLLQDINNIVDLIGSCSYQGQVPDLHQTLKHHLINKRGNTPETQWLLTRFISEFSDLSQQQRSITPSTYPDVMSDYLGMLQTETGNPDLALTNHIWVLNSCHEPHLLIPYELQEVLSGALSRYAPSQLILPHYLEKFRQTFVDSRLASKVLLFKSEQRPEAPEPLTPANISTVTPARGNRETWHSGSLDYGWSGSESLSSLDWSSLDEPPITEGQHEAMLSPDVPLNQTGNALANPPPPVQTLTTHPLLVDIIDNQPERLRAINRIVDLVSEEFDGDNPEPQETLRHSLRVKQEEIFDSEAALDEFQTAFEQLSAQQRRTAAPHPRNRLAGYLDLLQSGSPVNNLTLSDKIWVKDTFTPLHLLIPYSLEEALTGVLDGYEPAQLLLAERLAPFRNELVRPKIMDIINQRPWLLSTVNSVVDLLGSLHYSSNPDLFRRLKTILSAKRDTPFYSSRPALTGFLSAFKESSREQQRIVDLPPKEERLERLEFLQPEAGNPPLTLSDKVWVHNTCESPHLLTPYSMRAVLAGVLSNYRPHQLVLPPQLEGMRTFLVIERFDAIIGLARQHLAGTRGTLHNYLERFQAGVVREHQAQMATIDKNIHRDQLTGYLQLLQSKVRASRCEDREPLTLSDKIWVKKEQENITLLIPYQLDEALSGALAGYLPEQIEVPPELEDHRGLLVREDFTDIIHQAWLEHCQTESIATNRAPDPELRQCLHFNEDIKDNPFIIATINQVVDDIFVYEPDLMTTVSQYLSEQGGTDRYTDQQLNDYISAFKIAAAEEKSRLLTQSIKAGYITQRSRKELNAFLTLLPAIEDGQESLSLADRVWHRGEANGMSLLIPYTLAEILTGRIAGFDIESLLASPSLESWLPTLTLESLSNVLTNAYKEYEIDAIRLPITNKLNRLLYPRATLDAKIRTIAKEHGYPDIGVNTALGNLEIKKIVTRGECSGKLSGCTKNTYSTSKTPYTVMDVVLNTQQVEDVNDLLNINNLYNEKIGYLRLHAKNSVSLLRALAGYDWQSEALSLNEELEVLTGFKKTLSKLARKVRDNFPPPAEYQQYSLNIGSTTNRHPFIVALIDDQHETKRKVVGLYSYLTGQRFTFTQSKYGSPTSAEGVSLYTVKLSPDPFADTLRNGSEELIQWMILNGGDSALFEIQHGNLYYIDLNYYSEDGVDVFIEHVYAHASAMCVGTITNMVTTYAEAKEANKTDFFDIAKIVLSVVGVVPVVGDAIEIVGLTLCYEAQRSLTNDPEVKKRLRDEFLINLSVSAGSALLPVAGAAIGTAFKSVAKGLVTAARATKKITPILGKTAKEGIERGSKKLTGYLGKSTKKGLNNSNNLRTIKLDKDQLIDGLPNRKLDINGLPKQRTIKPGSKAFKKQCLTGRRKRTPRESCGFVDLSDLINGNAAKIKAEIPMSDAIKIKSHLESTYNNLGYVGRASAGNLDSAVRVFDDNLPDFKQILRKYDIDLPGNSLAKSCKDYLISLKSVTIPPYPKELVKATKKYKQYQDKITTLTKKLQANPSAKKAREARKVADELDTFKKDIYKPQQLAYDDKIYKQIDADPKFQQIKANDEAIRKLLPDSVNVEAPIQRTMRTWGYNVLLRRARSAASSTGAAKVAAQKPMLSIQDRVYQAKNLNFATKHGDRLPTLYFSNKEYGFGKLRQQHARGAKIEELRLYKEHAFFKNKEDLLKFKNQAKPLNIDDQLDRTTFNKILKDTNGIRKPKQGYYHAEASFDSGASSAPAVSIHTSSGTVVVGKELNRYKDSASQIYRTLKEADQAKKAQTAAKVAIPDP